MKENMLDIFYVVVVAACLAVFVNIAVTNKENTERLSTGYADQVADVETAMADNILTKYVGCELTGLEILNIIDMNPEYQYNLNIKINEDNFSYTILNHNSNFKDRYRDFAYLLAREVPVDKNATMIVDSVIWYEDNNTRCWGSLGEKASLDEEQKNEIEILNQMLPDKVVKLITNKSNTDSMEYVVTEQEILKLEQIKDSSAADSSLGPNKEIIEEMIFKPTLKYRTYPLYNEDGRWLVGLAFDYIE